ncbi:MAG: DUF3892 domain-containing protein [Myxococcales bacterium]|nr:DUF3892 domain-containing protein [Myxococcales bacterium]
MSTEQWICAVQKDTKNDNIVAVTAHGVASVMGKPIMSGPYTFSVAQVIAAIKAGTKFYTAWHRHGQFERRAEVTVEGRPPHEFIRTVPNSSTADNLDNLPPTCPA